MSRTLATPTLVAAPARVGQGNLTLDGVMAALCVWFQAGAYLDAWAHVHVPDLETFFTPWHGVLYSGFGAVAVATVAVLLRNRAAGLPWREVMPRGYGLSLAGVTIFAAGGAADMVWHLLFGIEADVEALLSPSHLVLAVGSTLFLTGPLRAAWARVDEPNAKPTAYLPAMLSLASLLSSFTFWTLYANPLVRPWAAAGNRPRAAMFELVSADPPILGGNPPTGFVAQGLGMAGVLVFAAILTALALLAVRRWGAMLPFGSFALVVTVNGLLVGFARDQLVLVPAIVGAGLATDLLYVRLRPSVQRVARLRTFAFAVPVAYFAAYFAALAITKGVWWSVHLWAGAIVLAGTVGWLLSYLVAPPMAGASCET